MRDLLSFVNLSVGLLLVVLWLGFPPPVIGQPPGSSAPLPFHVSADSIESKEGGRFLLVRGDVRIRRDNWSLYADEVEVDQQEEIFAARGSVLLFDGENQIQGSSLRYNYGTGKGVA